MITFPNSKINLGLNIINKRADGYHDLETCIYPISWHDILEIVPSKSFSFVQTGRNIPGDPTRNLCVKAYELIKKYYRIPPTNIHLHKIIPTGAGLGGGSSDAAFTLKMLNQLFIKNFEQTTESLCQFIGERLSLLYIQSTCHCLRNRNKIRTL